MVAARPLTPGANMRTLTCIGLLAPALLLSTSAHADCALGAGYYQTVTGNSAEVCLYGTSRTCGFTGGMLRQNTDTGELVLLADYCEPATASQGSCYLDECVAKGNYKYGFATPYDCTEEGCGGVQWWATASVTADPPASCARTSGNGAPTAYGKAAPWPANDTTGFRRCSGSGCSATGAAAMGLDGAVLLLSLLWVRRKALAHR
jgi:hypothetical protein